MVPKITILLKILRIIFGSLLVLSAIPALIQGVVSQYAGIDVPMHPDWRLIAFGLFLMGVGLILIRPLPWTSRRHN